jgi:hypothetical protein
MQVTTDRGSLLVGNQICIIERGARAMKLVVVTGMHRSGTSCIAGELVNCGMRVSHNLLPGDPANPKGYFEDPVLIALHDSMLTTVGSNWMDPAPLADGWLDRLEDRGLVSELSEYVARQPSDDGVFLVKDPRISRLLPVWKRVAASNGADLHVLHVYRNCRDVAASLWRRNNIPVLHALQLWARYNLDVEENAKDIARTRIDFDAFLENPSLLSDAANQFGFGLSHVERVGEFADAQLRHKVTTGEVRNDLAAGIHTELLVWNGFPGASELTSLYEACGGNALALERRHYGVIHSTLWTVVAEKKALDKKIARIQECMGQ